MRRNGLGELPSDRGLPPSKEILSAGDGGKFRNRVAMNNRLYVVTDTGQRVLPANIKRKYLILVNTGLQIIFVSYGNQGGVIGGVPIPPGGNYEPWVVPYSEVNAICASGQSSNLVIVEGFLEEFI